MTEKHYCYNTEQLGEVWGRIHVPLARFCSLRCTYCNHSFDGNVTSDAWRPGTASGVVEGEEAIFAYLKSAFTKCPDAKIIGVSGPGDPLENMGEMRNLVSVMHKHFPQAYLCLCTNGSIYNSEVQGLLDQGILRYITLTINTLNPDKYPLIYRRYQNPCVTRNMRENQLKIIRACVNNGVKIKVNTIFLQGINDTEIPELFIHLQHEGVNCFNLMPRINVVSGQLQNLALHKKLEEELLSAGVPLMTRCKHCRADHCECGKKGGDNP